MRVARPLWLAISLGAAAGGSLAAPANGYVLDFAQAPGAVGYIPDPPTVIDGFRLGINEWYVASLQGATTENPQGSARIFSLNDGGSGLFWISSDSRFTLKSLEIESVIGQVEFQIGRRVLTAPGVYNLTFNPKTSFLFEVRPLTRDGGSVRISNVTLEAFPAPVPEPATWAMLILGFGAIGTALRRTRQPQPALS